MNWNGMPIMHAGDSVAGSLAECFVTIDDERYNFMQAINLEAKLKKQRWKFRSSGRPGAEINRPAGRGQVPRHSILPRQFSEC